MRSPLRQPEGVTAAPSQSHHLGGESEPAATGRAPSVWWSRYLDIVRQQDETTRYEYDVALSFAGEDRDYVEVVADQLRLRGVRVFYDLYEQANLWGKDLYEHLDYVYRRAARYCLLFASTAYADKVWTRHERRSAQARAIEENREYVLPVKFDDTEIPGVLPTVGYVDARSTTAVQLADLISQKLGPSVKRHFVPPIPDRLYDKVGARSTAEREAVSEAMYAFFGVLRRMSVQERELVFQILGVGCPSELPENVHMSLDFLRRESGLPQAEILEVLKALGSLGFCISLREDDGDHHGDGDLASAAPIVALEWHDMTVYDDDDGSERNDTLVASAMVGLVLGDYCQECASNAVEHLDFSALARVTNRPGGHPSEGEDDTPSAEA